MNNTLPNLIIIGAMKCGTTSLHNYLNSHPQIQMSNLKELDYFVLEKNWFRGLNWYINQFPINNEAKIFGESSPNYTKNHIFPNVPQRMGSIIPDAKLIYILRDPIKRILSHYFHQFADRQEMRSLKDALLDKENNNYISSSKYYYQIEKYLPYYKIEQIFFLTIEDLKNNPTQSMQKIFRFLGVDYSFECGEFHQIYHLSSKKNRLNNLGYSISKLPAGMRLCNAFPKLFLEQVNYPVIDESILIHLQSVLSEDIEKLRNLTGMRFSEWHHV